MKNELTKKQQPLPTLMMMDERTRFAVLVSEIVNGLQLMGVPMEDKDKAAAAVARIASMVYDDFRGYTAADLKRAFDGAARGLFPLALQHYNTISARYVLGILNAYDRYRQQRNSERLREQRRAAADECARQWNKTRHAVLGRSWLRARIGKELKWCMPFTAIIRGRLERLGYPEDLSAKDARLAIKELADEGFTFTEWMEGTL